MLWVIDFYILHILGLERVCLHYLVPGIYGRMASPKTRHHILALQVPRQIEEYGRKTQLKRRIPQWPLFL
jgi:hypothetical protein